MLEQNLLVAGTEEKCARVSRQGASLMRIAVPIWNDKVSPLLHTTFKLLIVESKTQEEVYRFEVVLLEQDIKRRYYCLVFLKRIKGKWFPLCGRWPKILAKKKLRTSVKNNLAATEIGCSVRIGSTAGRASE